MSLIPIFATHEIQPAVLSSIPTTAYKAASEINTKPSLVIFTDKNRNRLDQYTYNDVTHPPLTASDVSERASACETEFRGLEPFFLHWTPETIATFLSTETDTHGPGKTVIDQFTFLVADGTTARDGDTLLLVHTLPDGLLSVRLSAAFVNTEAVAVAVGSKDVQELKSLVDEDGVFRGGQAGGWSRAKRGGKAPRKMLGQS